MVARLQRMFRLNILGVVCRLNKNVLPDLQSGSIKYQDL